jgi:hypothetical protein
MIVHLPRAKLAALCCWVGVAARQLPAVGFFTGDHGPLHAVCLQAAVRGLMSREHQMLTWHTIAGDLEMKQRALAEMDKSKVGQASACAPMLSLTGCRSGACSWW